MYSDYTIVEAYTLPTLIGEVKKLMELGWTPLGAASPMDGRLGHFMQTLVKPRETNQKKGK